MTGRDVRRRHARAVGAAALLVALVLPALAAPVAAAPPNLTLVTATTYDVRPDENRIVVTAEITARNRLRDTLARRFFFRTGYLAVLPGASGFTISGGSGTPKVRVDARAADHTLLRIDLGANLASGRSTTLTLSFDLRDAGGAPDRALRISPSLVTFDAWAFATPETPGSSVAVVLPDGYEVDLGRGPLEGPTPTAGGGLAWASGRLSDPLAFVADVTASRPAELLERGRTVAMAEGAAELLLRAWPDDPGWADRVGELVGRALPVLEREIGLPWPIDEPLAIEESLTGGGSGQAAVFDPADATIQVAYAAPDGVILRQLAHAWFNGRLVADRWIAEGFASAYAERAAEALGVEPVSPELDEALEQAAVPLNDWDAGTAGAGDPAGGESDDASGHVDAYGQAAALALARSIIERAGPAAMTGIWADAAAGLGAYQPVAEGDEASPGLADWRSLLDLLEDRAGRPFEDLWRRWVARPADLAALRERAAARGHHATTTAAAADWRLPQRVRDALRAWQFDTAEAELESADQVLELRDELTAEAGAAGLRLPDRLQQAFEGNDGFVVAEAEAEAELAVLRAIIEAEASRPAAASPADELVIAIGLVGTEPDARLDDATASLEAGDLGAAFEAAATAEDLWTDATRVGRGRIVSAGLLALSILLLVGLVRQRRRSAVRATV